MDVDKPAEPGEGPRPDAGAGPGPEPARRKPDGGAAAEGERVRDVNRTRAVASSKALAALRIVFDRERDAFLDLSSHSLIDVLKADALSRRLVRCSRVCRRLHLVVKYLEFVEVYQRSPPLPRDHTLRRSVFRPDSFSRHTDNSCAIW